MSDKPSPGAVAPELIPASVAAPLCHRSLASWGRDNSAGRIPAPVRIGRSTLWRRSELMDWIAAGCPVRSAWERMRAARR
jgi:hypothetical protein